MVERWNGERYLHLDKGIYQATTKDFQMKKNLRRHLNHQNQKALFLLHKLRTNISQVLCLIVSPTPNHTTLPLTPLDLANSEKMNELFTFTMTFQWKGLFPRSLTKQQTYKHSLSLSPSRTKNGKKNERECERQRKGKEKT